MLARSLEEGEVFTTQELEGDEAVRLLSVPIIESPGRAYGILQVGQSLAGVYASQQVLGFLLLGAVPLTLVIASVGGLFLANRALGPIDRLTRRARTITAQDLSQRMDVKHGNDEVGRLATTLDEMIGRLEAAFLSQRRFAADASHELRTPLAVVRSSVDLALDRERTTDEYRETLLSVRQEVARMSRIVNDLLVLARADAGRQPLELEEFAADKLLLDIVESAHPLAAEYDMMIRRGEVAEVDIRADESRLTQLVLNLVDNAIKYTPAGGSIVLSSKVEWDGDSLRGERHGNRRCRRGPRADLRAFLQSRQGALPREGEQRARPFDRALDRRGPRWRCARRAAGRTGHDLRGPYSRRIASRGPAGVAGSRRTSQTPQGDAARGAPSGSAHLPLARPARSITQS